MSGDLDVEMEQLPPMRDVEDDDVSAPHHHHGHHKGMSVNCEKTGTFVIAALLTLFAFVAVMGLIVHLTRAADEYRWTTVSDTVVDQATYTTQWSLRAENEHRYLSIETDYQILDVAPIFNSLAGGFPLEHLPVNMLSASTGHVVPLQIGINGSLNMGDSAFVLIFPTGESIIGPTLIVSGATYGSIINSAILGFTDHVLLTDAVAFGTNSYHYLTHVAGH
jgi:hypothetical protein